MTKYKTGEAREGNKVGIVNIIVYGSLNLDSWLFEGRITLAGFIGTIIAPKIRKNQARVLAGWGDILVRVAYGRFGDEI